MKEIVSISAPTMFTVRIYLFISCGSNCQSIEPTDRIIIKTIANNQEKIVKTFNTSDLGYKGIIIDTSISP